MTDHWNLPVLGRYSDGDYPEPKLYRGFSGTGSVWADRQIHDRYASGTYSDSLISDTVTNSLHLHAESADDRPFFAYIATTAPHDPRTAPGEYLAKYDQEEIRASRQLPT